MRGHASASERNGLGPITNRAVLRRKEADLIVAWQERQAEEMSYRTLACHRTGTVAVQQLIGLHGLDAVTRKGSLCIDSLLARAAGKSQAKFTDAISSVLCCASTDKLHE